MPIWGPIIAATKTVAPYAIGAGGMIGAAAVGKGKAPTVQMPGRAEEAQRLLSLAMATIPEIPTETARYYQSLEEIERLIRGLPAKYEEKLTPYITELREMQRYIPTMEAIAGTPPISIMGPGLTTPISYYPIRQMAGRMDIARVPLETELSLLQRRLPLTQQMLTSQAQMPGFLSALARERFGAGPGWVREAAMALEQARFGAARAIPRTPGFAETTLPSLAYLTAAAMPYIFGGGQQPQSVQPYYVPGRPQMGMVPGWWRF